MWLSKIENLEEYTLNNSDLNKVKFFLEIGVEETKYSLPKSEEVLLATLTNTG